MPPSGPGPWPGFEPHAARLHSAAAISHLAARVTLSSETGPGASCGRIMAILSLRWTHAMCEGRMRDDPADAGRVAGAVFRITCYRAIE